jgi:hypothetical protein
MRKHIIVVPAIFDVGDFTGDEKFIACSKVCSTVCSKVSKEVREGRRLSALAYVCSKVVQYVVKSAKWSA